MLRSASTKSYSLNNYTDEEVCKLLRKCHWILHIIIQLYNLPPKLTIHSLFAPGQFAPGSESANRTLANSLPGQLAPWNFRSLAHSLPGLLAPWNFRSPERSPERNGPGTFVPWNFRTQEYSLPGTFAPWNFRSLLVRDIICDTRYILMILTFMWYM